jgi:uncharacterized protein (TIGR03435 family)
MNAIQILSAQPWVERLGWTLLHFLWQGVLIAVVYAAARRWTASASGPGFRYLLACAALAVMVTAPVLTWSLLRPPASPSIASPYTAAISAAAPSAAGNVPALSGADVYLAVPAAFLPWVVAVWLTGAVAFWLRLFGGWILAERLRSRLVRPAPRQWQQALDRLKGRIQVSRPVRLLMSSLVEAPAVVGWLRPVVLVPVGALAGLPPEQIEALLLHELAHIRRHDYLVNLLQSFVEAVLFYHPAVWWVSGHIRAEREHCCDDVAVSVSGDVLNYARALAELESARTAHLGPVMAATGGSLAHRVARLLGQSRPAPGTVSGPGIAAAATFLAVMAFSVFGQPVAQSKFEVASVKPSIDRGFKSVRPLPGRLTADAPLRMLLQNAYSVQAFQIVGGPGWIDSDHYAIEAKAAGDPGRGQIFLMLRSLLEDRFHLQIHRETRELPVYALAAGKNGLKLSPPKEECMDPVPSALPQGAGGRMPPPGQGQPPLAPCGRVGIMLDPGGAMMRGGKIPMAELTRTLSMVLDRTVVDKTGFTGLFDLRLGFLPDETTAALPPPPPDAAGASLDSRYPSILTALQEQLGLRLESTKGPVEVIVIDHVERPSAN